MSIFTPPPVSALARPAAFRSSVEDRGDLGRDCQQIEGNRPLAGKLEGRELTSVVRANVRSSTGPDRDQCSRWASTPPTFSHLQIYSAPLRQRLQPLRGPAVVVKGGFRRRPAKVKRSKCATSRPDVPPERHGDEGGRRADQHRPLQQYRRASRRGQTRRLPGEGIEEMESISEVLCRGRRRVERDQLHQLDAQETLERSNLPAAVVSVLCGRAVQSWALPLPSSRSSSILARCSVASTYGEITSCTQNSASCLVGLASQNAIP